MKVPLPTNKSNKSFQQVIVFYFLTDFEMYTIFRQKSFYSTFSCLKKANTAISKFYVSNHLKISAFDKS